MKQQPDEDEDFVCRICIKKRALQKAGGQKPKQRTDSTSPSPVTTPIKQTMISTASQEIITKTVAMTQGVVKVHSSGRSSGRSSPATVSSGRNSPTLVPKKEEAQGSSGRNSPALSTSGRKTPSAMSLGRNSPLTLSTGRSSPATVTMHAATGRKSPALTLADRKSPLIFTSKSEMTKDGPPELDITSQSAMSVQKAVESILPMDKDTENKMVCEENDQVLVQKQSVKLAVVTKPSSEITEVKSSPHAVVVPLITSKPSDEGSETQKEGSVASAKIIDSQEPMSTNEQPSASVASSQMLCESVQSETSVTVVKSETVAAASLLEIGQEVSEAIQEPSTTEELKCENTVPDGTSIHMSQSDGDDSKDTSESNNDMEPMPVDAVTSNEEVETKVSEIADSERKVDPKPLSPSSEQMEVQLAIEACQNSGTESEQPQDDGEVAVESENLPEEPIQPTDSQSSESNENEVPPAVSDDALVAQPSSPPTLIKEPESNLPDTVETLEPPLVEPVELEPIATQCASSKAPDAPALIQEEEDKTTPSEPSEPMEVTESLDSEPRQESEGTGETFPERVCDVNDEQMESSTS